MFKENQQDQLILTKIRFEQRIIQVKSILQEQGKIVDQLRREVELLKIAKAYEKTEIENASQNLALKKLLNPNMRKFGSSEYDETSLFDGSPSVAHGLAGKEESKDEHPRFSKSHRKRIESFGIGSPVKVHHDMRDLYQS